MGAHPPSITPSFPDHKTETNGHQCCDFKGRSNLPIRLNGGARWEFFNEKPGSSWLPPKKQGLLRVDIFGGYLLVLFKKCVFIFCSYVFLIACLKCRYAIYNQKISWLYGYLFVGPPGDTVINHGRVIYLSLLIRCPKVRCGMPQRLLTDPPRLHMNFPWKHLVGTLLFITFCK